MSSHNRKMLEDARRRLGKPASPKEPLSLNYSEI